MPLIDFMGSILKGFFDPSQLAREMAQNNISPDELMAQVQKTQQLQTMPTAGAQTGSNAAEQANNPFSIGKMLQDLMQGTPPTAQAGQAGNALGSSLGQVGPDMNNLLGGAINSLGQTPPTAQAGQAGQAISNRLGSLMQPATGATAPAPTGNAAAVMQQPTLPPMPPQLQGLPNALGAMAPNPANGTPGGNQFPPIMLPNLATSQFPGRPGVIGSNLPQLPQQMQVPGGVNPNTPLAMQPNTQPMQPNRGGVERPESATSPNMNQDALGIRNTALSTWYSGGVTNPFGLAALTSTGEHESGFNPANLARTWADPSESGGKGTSGGMFSWRNERLQALQSYAKSKGEEGNGSAQTQAEFFMKENPDVVKQLNGAKSVEEAQRIMDKNIAFAGYNREGGEASRRLQTARTLVPQMDEFVKNPQSPPTPTTAGGGDTAVPPPSSASASDPTKGPFGFLDALEKNSGGDGQEPELNLPKPPAPVAPSPGRYDVNPQAMQLMMMMLNPAMGGAQVPSLAQLMGGR